MNQHIRPAIIVFPASNCERDIAFVLKEVFKLDPILIWHTETYLPYDVSHVIVPGGFSFGDYLRAGALAALSPIMSVIKERAQAGLPTMGICNGFQILCEAKLLPGVLLRNHHDRFICEVVPMTWHGARKKCLPPKKIKLPIAHRDGRYYADDKTLTELKNAGQLALIYDEANEHGDAMVNGAKACIAGITGGPTNNILGLMPHPERMANADILGDDGLIILYDFLFGWEHEKAAAGPLEQTW